MGKIEAIEENSVELPTEELEEVSELEVEEELEEKLEEKYEFEKRK